MVAALFWLVGEAIHLLILAIIIWAVLSMLISFGVVDWRNPLVRGVNEFLTRLVMPVLQPIRQVVPFFGAVDLSPLIAILLLQALQMVLADLFMRLAMSGMAY
ncbi:YggT family protein [Acidocella sp.]|uniref:YggT family protein n=1 Tax=Acidocella sp. TaxID=50710 RepID=UPI0026259D26|nr:YggT family protein [Acidocella sp.]